MIVDYHMHLRRPGDDGVDAAGEIDHTVEAIERYVDVAAERGVDEIGFTEHVYYFEQTRSLWSVPYQLDRCRFDLDVYVDAVLEAKRQGLPVKLALEVDCQPHLLDETAEILDPYPWDYLVGSVHYVDGFGVDAPPRLIDEFGDDGAWWRYFGWLTPATKLVDVLAHPDLIKIFGGLSRPDSALIDYEELAAYCEWSSTALEVSTAGLHKPVGELYPAGEWLQIAREMGTGITLASDAHQPDHVGRDLDKAIAHARAAGYDTVTIFDQRQQRQEPLG